MPIHGNGAIFSPPFCTRAALVRISLSLILQCILIGRHIVAFTSCLLRRLAHGLRVDGRADTLINLWHSTSETNPPTSNRSCMTSCRFQAALILFAGSVISAMGTDDGTALKSEEKTHKLYFFEGGGNKGWSCHGAACRGEGSHAVSTTTSLTAPHHNHTCLSSLP
jgi:hypothetical protein